jgi:hypothetical protein
MGPLAVCRPVLTTVLGRSGFLLSVDFRWGAIAGFGKGTMAGTMRISTPEASLVGTYVASTRAGVCTARMNVVGARGVAGVGPITEGVSSCTPSSITATYTISYQYAVWLRL